MSGNTAQLLFSILRSVIHGNQMNDADRHLVTDDLLKDMIKLASKHDIVHIIALGILNNGLADEETKTQLQQITFRAVYRYEKPNYELKQVCDALEKAEIPFLPLKGSVIRKYYPEPWMQTSCDIDVLVQEKNLRVAVSYLVKNLKYTEHKQNSHDISLFSQSGNHIELHFDLVEDYISDSSSKILADVWNVVTVKEDCSSSRSLTWYGSLPPCSSSALSQSKLKSCVYIMATTKLLYCISFAIRFKCPQNISLHHLRTSMNGVNHRCFCKIG